jgi:hypothetical protein
VTQEKNLQIAATAATQEEKEEDPSLICGGCGWFANWKFGDGRDWQRSFYFCLLCGIRLIHKILFSLHSPPPPRVGLF